jgi:predicted Fe-Mo cluster-binding NifX family protein
VRDGIHIGVKVIKAVIVHNPDIVFTPRIGEISFYMLKDHFIEVFKAAEGMTVREVIEKYRRGEIEPVIPHPAEESETEKERTDGSPGDSDSAL